MYKLKIKNEEEWQVLVQWISQSIYSLSGCMYADELNGCRAAIKLAGQILVSLSDIAESGQFPTELLIETALLEEVMKDPHGPFPIEPINPQLPEGDRNILTRFDTVEYLDCESSLKNCNYNDFLDEVKSVFHPQY